MKDETDKSLNAYTASLRESPTFKLFVEKRLAPGIPPVQRYSPDASHQSWVYSTGLQDGYLMALRKFGLILRQKDDRTVEPEATG